MKISQYCEVFQRKPPGNEGKGLCSNHFFQELTFIRYFCALKIKVSLFAAYGYNISGCIYISELHAYVIRSSCVET